MAHPTGFEPMIFRRTPVRVNLALVVEFTSIRARPRTPQKRGTRLSLKLLEWYEPNASIAAVKSVLVKIGAENLKTLVQEETDHCGFGKFIPLTYKIIGNSKTIGFV